VYACEVRYGRGRTPPAAEGLARCPSHREPLLLPTHRPAAHALYRGTRKGPPPPCLPAAAGNHLFPGDLLACLPALSPAPLPGPGRSLAVAGSTLLGWGDSSVTPIESPTFDLRCKTNATGSSAMPFLVRIYITSILSKH
jgi:hypothetical protein